METGSPSAKSSSQQYECCVSTQEHAFAVIVTADNGHDYLFGTAQFLEAELKDNPNVEADEKAPPERLDICFATGEVVVLGRGLTRVTRLLQRCGVESIKPLGRRYAALQLP